MHLSYNSVQVKIWQTMMQIRSQTELFSDLTSQVRDTRRIGLESPKPRTAVSQDQLVRQEIAIGPHRTNRRQPRQQVSHLHAGSLPSFPRAGTPASPNSTRVESTLRRGTVPVTLPCPPLTKMHDRRGPMRNRLLQNLRGRRKDMHEDLLLQILLKHHLWQQHPSQDQKSVKPNLKFIGMVRSVIRLKRIYNF
jgi:hypothetical protein